MQVNETLNEGLKRELDIVIPASQMKDRMEAKLVEMKGQVQLKGFRKGKVPVAHLRQMYGKSIMSDILQEELNQSSQKAISDRSEKPAMQPKIELPEDQGAAEKMLNGEADLAYKISYEIVPAIEELDYSKLAIERPVVDVSDEDINKRLEEIGESNRPYETKNGAAEDGDRLTIAYLGKLNGEPFEGGQDDNAMLVLGSNQFIPGFEEQLIGAKAGDEKTIKVTFPDDYQAELLKGQDAEFDVTVRDVAAPGEVVLDDEFAKRLGLESLDKLREAVQQQVEGQFGSATRQKVKRQLLDQLDEMHTFDLPPTLVEQEFENIWRQVTHDIEHHGKTFEDEGTTEEEAKADYQKIAERRVRLGLVLAEIGDSNKIQVNDEELQRALIEQIRQFPGQEQQAFDYYRKNPEAMASLRAPIFEEKVVDYLLELATVTDKTVTKEELTADEDDDDAPHHDHDHDHDH
uniref:trigger factor n=1 Tax=Pararhizobium sp. IMCC3301 TaxID=3067904 RepID=UPI002740F6E3|nr:trigger factor [Pararhizobium sp. IMCC3301]